MAARIASLPMYNLPEMAAVNRAFWQALAAELRAQGLSELPDQLRIDRPPVPERIDSDTLFTQTCGYPLQTIYRGQYQPLAVPSYDAPGCGEATHCAFVLVRADAAIERPEQLRGKVFAVNSRHSNSGMNLPRILLARLAGGAPVFARVIETGGHPASMRLVQSGEADAASIDCVTYALLGDYRPEAIAGLRILCETPASPAIPFITAASTPAATVAALQRALLRLGTAPEHQPVRAPLRLRRIDPIQPARYHVLLDYERDAAALGYAELR